MKSKVRDHVLWGILMAAIWGIAYMYDCLPGDESPALYYWGAGFISVFSYLAMQLSTHKVKAEEIKAIEELAHYVSDHIHRNDKGEILITDPDGEVLHLYVSRTYEKQLKPYLGKGVDLCGSCYNLKQIFKTNGFGYPICHECYGVTRPKIKPQSTMRVVHGGRKVGRNDECPCGSEMKYKKCCLKKSAKY